MKTGQLILLLVTVAILGSAITLMSRPKNEGMTWDEVKAWIRAEREILYPNDPNEGQLHVTQIGEDEYGKKYKYEMFDGNDWIVLDELKEAIAITDPSDPNDGTKLTFTFVEDEWKKRCDVDFNDPNRIEFSNQELTFEDSDGESITITLPRDPNNRDTLTFTFLKDRWLLDEPKEEQVTDIVGKLIGNVRIRPAVMNTQTGEVFYTGVGFDVKAEIRND